MEAVDAQRATEAEKTPHNNCGMPFIVFKTRGGLTKDDRVDHGAQALRNVVAHEHAHLKTRDHGWR